MSILTDLAQAWPLAIIAGGVGFIATFGRDPKADEHDLSDYHAPTRDDWAEIESHQRRWRELNKKPVEVDPAADYTWGRADFTWGFAGDILPPAPEGMDAGSPLWRSMVVDTAVPPLSDEQVRAKADEWLREIRAEVLAGAR